MRCDKLVEKSGRGMKECLVPNDLVPSAEDPGICERAC